MSRPPRVLIAGAGVAGLEAALALRNRAGERVAVEGAPDVWAVGDAGAFRVKQGGIACEFADRRPLSWPVSKVAGRFLAPFLRGYPRGSTLVDIPAAGPPLAAEPEPDAHDAGTRCEWCGAEYPGPDDGR